MLNRQTAIDYVVRHLTDLGYEDIVIIGATRRKPKGEPPLIDVTFSYRSEESESGTYEGLFTVWIHDNKLHGEW